MSRSKAKAAGGFALALFASCSDTTGPTFRGPERILIEVEAGADTIESPHARLVTVTVTDSAGLRGAGIDVQAIGPVVDQSLMLTLNGQPNLSSVSATTNDSGRTTFSVKSRLKAGTFYLKVRVISANVIDSIPITVLAGNPHNVVFTPSDTAVLVGAQYALGISVIDRWFNVNAIASRTIENLRTDVISFAGGSVSSVGEGRGTIRVTSGDVVREAHVSVVPPGVLIAYMDVGLPQAGLYTVTTDGVTSTKIVGLIGGAPRWSPGADRIAYHSGGRIHSTDMQGNASPLIPNPYGALSEIQPQYSRDGNWIFYVAQPGGDKFEIWRVQSNGASPTRIGPVAEVYNHDTSPTPSPDGQRVAFATNRVLAEQGLVLQVLTVATGAVSAINIPGRLPRWAPSGEQIAYLHGQQVGIVNADGSNNRLFLGEFIDDNGSVDWSPDGKWLVSCAGTDVSGQRILVIINATTGEQLPIPATRTKYLCAPSWRP
jgi:hypothetical protein